MSQLTGIGYVKALFASDSGLKKWRENHDISEKARSRCSIVLSRMNVFYKADLLLDTVAHASADDCARVCPDASPYLENCLVLFKNLARTPILAQLPPMRQILGDCDIPGLNSFCPI